MHCVSNITGTEYSSVCCRKKSNEHMKRIIELKELINLSKVFSLGKSKHWVGKRLKMSCPAKTTSEVQSMNVQHGLPVSTFLLRRWYSTCEISNESKMLKPFVELTACCLEKYSRTLFLTTWCTHSPAWYLGLISSLILRRPQAHVWDKAL